MKMLACFFSNKKLESSEGRQLQPRQNGVQARKQSEDRSSCCGIPKPPGLQRGNSYNNFEIVQDFENKDVFFRFIQRKMSKPKRFNMTFKAPPRIKGSNCLSENIPELSRTTSFLSLLDGNWNIHTAPEAIP